MIPVKYLEDLKSAPVNDVDFVATFIEVSKMALAAHLLSDDSPESVDV